MLLKLPLNSASQMARQLTAFRASRLLREGLPASAVCPGTTANRTN